MIHLVYVSSATDEFGREQLLELLNQSRERNRSRQVTGMLLYADGNFFQVLEGNREDVHAIYRSIVEDPRNAGNIVIEEREIEKRVFPGWAMGFRDLRLADASALEGYSDFLNGRLPLEELADDGDRVIELLYRFREQNLRV